jgi:hypothetical protein
MLLAKYRTSGQRRPSRVQTASVPTSGTGGTDWDRLSRSALHMRARGVIVEKSVQSVPSVPTIANFHFGPRENGKVVVLCGGSYCAHCHPGAEGWSTDLPPGGASESPHGASGKPLPRSLHTPAKLVRGWWRATAKITETGTLPPCAVCLECSATRHPTQEPGYIHVRGTTCSTRPESELTRHSGSFGERELLAEAAVQTLADGGCEGLTLASSYLCALVDPTACDSRHSSGQPVCS